MHLTVGLKVSSFTGFADLGGPCDLLRKLQHDHGRMVSNPADSYAAFDFFVTAEHILDWLHPDPGGEPARKTAREHNTLLQITSHIASGAKHFEARDRRHKSVSGIHKEGYADDYADGYVDELIIITLSSDEAIVLGSAKIDAVALGHRVLAYWQGHLAC